MSGPRDRPGWWIADPADMPAGRAAVVGRLRRLCVAAKGDLSASGVGVSVLARDGVRAATVATDPTTQRIEELHLLLGEGPCLDALTNRRPVLVGALDGPAMSRWPLYCSAVHGDGIRAVFAFPLQIGAAQLGVLDIFRTYAGSLKADEVTRALGFADQAVRTLINEQDPAAGAVADGTEEDVEYHAVLFQAQGMVMVQLGVSLIEAMVRIRAYAFAEERRLTDVARDIVARLVRFEPDR